MFLIMFTLKLCGVIAWSWWWVTAPIWGYFALLFFIFTGAFVLGCFCMGVAEFLAKVSDDIEKRRNKK